MVNNNISAFLSLLTNNKLMNSIKTILAAMAMTLAVTSGAQTLKMTNQVVRITAYEASTSVNLVVVKPEQKLDVLDPSVFTVETNGVESL